LGEAKEKNGFGDLNTLTIIFLPVPSPFGELVRMVRKEVSLWPEPERGSVNRNAQQPENRVSIEEGGGWSSAIFMETEEYSEKKESLSYEKEI